MGGRGGPRNRGNRIRFSNGQMGSQRSRNKGFREPIDTSFRKRRSLTEDLEDASSYRFITFNDTLTNTMTVNDNLRSGAIGLLGLAALALALNPAPAALLPGQEPPSSQYKVEQSPCGGRDPRSIKGDNPRLGDALSLLPEGAVAISVYGPGDYHEIREDPYTGKEQCIVDYDGGKSSPYDPVCVIYTVAEKPTYEQPPAYYGKRKKRWASRLSKVRQRRSPQRATSRMARSMGRFFKKFANNLQCLGPRLARKLGRRRREATYDALDEEDEVLNGVEDCFEYAQGPLYGFTCEFTLVDKEPCDPCADTCRFEDGSLDQPDPYQDPQYLTERQGGALTLTQDSINCQSSRN